jgi:hypothetical protein
VVGGTRPLSTGPPPTPSRPFPARAPLIAAVPPSRALPRAPSPPVLPPTSTRRDESKRALQARLDAAASRLDAARAQLRSQFQRAPLSIPPALAVPRELLKSRTAEGIKRLSLSVDQSFGVVRARDLRAKPRRDTPPTPQPSASPFVEPFAMTPRDQTQREAAELASEITSFTLSLPALDAAVFRTGHRLSTKQRDALLGSMSAEQISSRGLRFSDDGVDLIDTPACAASRLARRADSEPATASYLAILMDGWHTIDPLMMELAVDIFRNGINLAFNGDREMPTPDIIPPNMTRPHKPEHAVLVSAMQADIDAGKADGWFTEPPFPNCRPIPAGMVEKDFSLPKDDPKAWRIVKNYSHSARSVNAETDTVISPFQRWSSTVDQFIGAGRDSFAVKFDKESAFPSLSIRIQDRFLTTSFVPKRGWTHRRRGDFGHKTCGFRWEAPIGRLLSSLYHTMSYRLRCKAGSISLLPPPAFDMTCDPLVPPPEGFCAWSDVDLMLSPRAIPTYARLDGAHFIQAHGLVDLRRTARWVDDFKRHFSTHEKAFAGGLAYIFLHARYGIGLKPSKFEGPRQSIDFGGIDFHGKGARQGLSTEKALKIISKLSPVLKGAKLSHKEWESTCGSINFGVRAYPSGRGFVAPFYAAQAAALSAMKASTSPSEHARLVVASADAKRAASFWKEALLLAPPSAASFSRSPMADYSDADVIVHTDWAPEQGDNVIGVFVLSHGAWCCAKAPPYFCQLAVGPGGESSSPALEGLAEALLMATFPHIVDGKNVLMFGDNIPWIQATMSMASSSQAVDHALQLSALGQMTYNTHIARRYVPTDRNLADSLSHHDLQRFRAEISSCGLSASPSPATPSFVTPPPSWLQLLASS